MDTWDLRVSPDGPKYRAICDALAEAITSGTLAPGRKLPSHRMLARKLGVSVATVTRAYEEAVERGLITGEVGRGSFVRYSHSYPLQVADSSRIPASTLDLYQNLPAPIPEVESEAWHAAIAQLQCEPDLAAATRASWSQTSRQYQEAGAAWIRRTGLDPSPRSIVDCPGIQAALCAILGAMTSPGDLLLAPHLSHPGIKILAEQYSLHLQDLPMDRHGIEPEAFEKACKGGSAKLLYFAFTIHSPTTITMPEERRKTIAAIAERHGVYIIEDESAAFLLPDPPLPIAAFAPGRSFFIGEVWMALSLGLRTCYVSVPQSAMTSMARAVAATSGVTPPLSARIATMWIESGTADRLIEHRRAELELRNAMTLDILGRRRLRSHRHGNHVWLELPEPWTADVATVRMAQAGVAVQGADWFVVHGRVPEAVRISIGNAPDREQLCWALRTIDELLEQSHPHGEP